MTSEELEDLKEIEKDFDKDTAKQVYEAGYRKVYNNFVCAHCGKQFMGYADRTLAVIHYKNDKKESTMARVRLCPSCWLDLLERRDKVDDEFFSELKTVKGE